MLFLQNKGKNYLKYIKHQSSSQQH